MDLCRLLRVDRLHGIYCVMHYLKQEKGVVVRFSPGFYAGFR